MSDIDPGINPELKQRWLEALTSGEYLHGTDTLHIHNADDESVERHCCFGVLCMIDKRFVGDSDKTELTDEECWILGISLTTKSDLITANDKHSQYDSKDGEESFDFDQFPDTVLDIIRNLHERA